jgi:uridine phosphorylase
MNIREDNFSNLFMSRLYTASNANTDISIAGPLIGAPYAAMLLETLVAWGAQKIILFGWCGGVSLNVKIGDIIVPTASIIDEGTSKHYGIRSSKAMPSKNVVRKIQVELIKENIKYHKGTIWSTDAIFRETPRKVKNFQKKDVLAVDMEMSAFFAVGRYRSIEVGGILVVSDELATFKWRPGFREKRFKQNRKVVCEAIQSLCRVL